MRCGRVCVCVVEQRTEVWPWQEEEREGEEKDERGGQKGREGKRGGGGKFVKGINITCELKKSQKDVQRERERWCVFAFASMMMVIIIIVRRR